MFFSVYVNLLNREKKICFFAVVCLTFIVPNFVGLSNLRQHAGLLPESMIWGYIVQLSSVLRSIHAAGLACRAFDPSKILITGKSRYDRNYSFK